MEIRTNRKPKKRTSNNVCPNCNDKHHKHTTASGNFRCGNCDTLYRPLPPPEPKKPERVDPTEKWKTLGFYSDYEVSSKARFARRAYVKQAVRGKKTFNQPRPRRILVPIVKDKYGQLYIRLNLEVGNKIIGKCINAQEAFERNWPGIKAKVKK